MKPYNYIFHIVDDLIAAHTAIDYNYMYLSNNIRFDHRSYSDLLKAYPNSRPAGELKNKYEIYNVFESDIRSSYDKGSWFKNNSRNNWAFKKQSSCNFIEHQWEPIWYITDQIFWDDLVIMQKEHNTKYTIIHSERNSKDIEKLEKFDLTFIHWFAHAYLCSEFYYKHYQKLKMVTDYKARPVQYRWLCANRLIRKYRTDFLELLHLDKGCYSFLNPDPNGVVYHGSVIANSFDVHGNHSAEICIDNLTPWNTSFLHIVNETVWQDKIHFSEKVFKPIVLHQPFVVLQAPGSLAYLRSYGFKTFGAWWDEGYDTIEDPQQRMQAIADIVNAIGAKSLEELETMRMEMASVLEHNFRHFYENIPAICLDELRKGIANL